MIKFEIFKDYQKSFHAKGLESSPYTTSPSSYKQPPWSWASAHSTNQANYRDQLPDCIEVRF
jgi:hypothetical protein